MATCITSCGSASTTLRNACAGVLRFEAFASRPFQSANSSLVTRSPAFFPSHCCIAARCAVAICGAVGTTPSAVFEPCPLIRFATARPASTAFFATSFTIATPSCVITPSIELTLLRFLKLESAAAVFGNCAAIREPSDGEVFAAVGSSEPVLPNCAISFPVISVPSEDFKRAAISWKYGVGSISERNH